MRCNRKLTFKIKQETGSKQSPEPNTLKTKQNTNVNNKKQNKTDTGESAKLGQNELETELRSGWRK